MIEPSTAQNYRWHLPLLLIVFLFSFFINNGAIFADIMESRNIVTAREMVYDHHWLVPTMNGELRLEKPPLPTWIAAFVEMASPDNLPLQRAMAGCAAMLPMICSKVVFPAPLGPTMLTISPLSISRSIPFNTCKEPKFLVIPSSFIISAFIIVILFYNRFITYSAR